MLRQASILLCSAVAALLAIGLTILASTSAWVHGIEEPYLFLRRQVIMAGIGLVLAIAATRISPEWLRKYSLWMLAGVSVLLALCFVPGIGVETLGSKRWVQFPLLPQFQPSEVAKLATIIALASWFARWQSEVHSFWRGFVMPGILAGVPLLLIAAETDVGTALTLAMVVAGLLFCMGTRLRYLVPTALLAISAVGYYIFNNPVRWSRVIAWWDLENPIYQADKGMQQWRSLLALGNGGPWGAGLGNGIEKFGTLTFAHIDFIFPVVGEELGLPATLGVVLCFVRWHRHRRPSHSGLQPRPRPWHHLPHRRPLYPKYRRHHCRPPQRRLTPAICQLRRHQSRVQPRRYRTVGRYPPPLPMRAASGISPQPQNPPRTAALRPPLYLLCFTGSACQP